MVAVESNDKQLTCLLAGDTPITQVLSWRLNLMKTNVVLAAHSVPKKGKGTISWKSSKYGSNIYKPSEAIHSLRHLSSTRKFDIIVMSAISMKELQITCELIFKFCHNKTVIIVDSNFAVELDHFIVSQFPSDDLLKHKPTVVAMICDAEVRMVSATSYYLASDSYKYVFGLSYKTNQAELKYWQNLELVKEQFKDPNSKLNKFLQQLSSDKVSRLIKLVPSSKNTTNEMALEIWHRIIPKIAVHILSIVFQQCDYEKLLTDAGPVGVFKDLVFELMNISSHQAGGLLKDFVNETAEEGVKNSNLLSMINFENVIKLAKRKKRKLEKWVPANSPQRLNLNFEAYCFYHRYEFPANVLLSQPILVADRFGLRSSSLNFLCGVYSQYLAMTKTLPNQELFSKQEKPVFPFGPTMQFPTSGREPSRNSLKPPPKRPSKKDISSSMREKKQKKERKAKKDGKELLEKPKLLAGDSSNREDEMKGMALSPDSKTIGDLDEPTKKQVLRDSDILLTIMLQAKVDLNRHMSPELRHPDLELPPDLQALYLGAETYDFGLHMSPKGPFLSPTRELMLPRVTDKDDEDNKTESTERNHGKYDTNTRGKLARTSPTAPISATSNGHELSRLSAEEQEDDDDDSEDEDSEDDYDESDDESNECEDDYEEEEKHGYKRNQYSGRETLRPLNRRMCDDEMCVVDSTISLPSFQRKERNNLQYTGQYSESIGEFSRSLTSKYTTDLEKQIRLEPFTMSKYYQEVYQPDEFDGPMAHTPLNSTTLKPMPTALSAKSRHSLDPRTVSKLWKFQRRQHMEMGQISRPLTTPEDSLLQHLLILKRANMGGILNVTTSRYGDVDTSETIYQDWRNGEGELYRLRLTGGNEV
ncbi:AFR517Cp [Eremothecium gossypii ATCC 10895]|uniref:AFR517Cp n=1 Tax=Eremothecium gossypii (strain ATCC 10895 / CBS 109.51 / FGSC 9923 / NRRL Y-1056) TaxID=284811 RepID=Q752Q6_EREGS|nr:AFR517Cp [Eremothecium gossypii ATCC 10895]AAS53888.1 AFR517Cp [Eremothecium gossypii ATCC 10895]